MILVIDSNRSGLKAKLNSLMVLAIIIASVSCSADPKDMEPISIVYAFDEQGRRIGISDERVFPFKKCRIVADESARMKMNVGFMLSRIAKGKKVASYGMQCRKHRSVMIQSDKYYYYVSWRVSDGSIL